MPELKSAQRCCRAPWLIQSPANASQGVNELDITKPLWRSRTRVFSGDGGEVGKLNFFLHMNPKGGEESLSSPSVVIGMMLTQTAR